MHDSLAHIHSASLAAADWTGQSAINLALLALTLTASAWLGWFIARRSSSDSQVDSSVLDLLSPLEIALWDLSSDHRVVQNNPTGMILLEPEVSEVPLGLTGEPSVAGSPSLAANPGMAGNPGQADPASSSASINGKFTDWVAEHDRERVAREFDRALRGQSSQFELETLHNGRILRITSSVQEDPPVLRTLGLDITNLREAQADISALNESVQQTQKLQSLGVLAGGIAHDFNNLLVAIMGNAGLALMDLPESSTVREQVHNIEEAATRASELCAQVLAYSGRGRLRMQPIDLSSLMRDMVQLLHVSVSKRASMEMDLTPKVWVESDATQLRQLFMNLITNASDSLSETNEGKITIRTGHWSAEEVQEHCQNSEEWDVESTPIGDCVYVEVEDNGCGMDEETMRRLFEPFFTTKSCGRGLGMAATRGIIRNHGAGLSIHTAVGQGTTIRILFSACAIASNSQRNESDESPTQPGSGKIMVVDDEETVRLISRTVLERAGYEVIEAEDGFQALLQAEQNHSDLKLVVMDLTMPRLNGVETQRQLKDICPDVPVILTSGFNEEEVAELHADKGFTAFLQKPYRPQRLLVEIERALKIVRAAS